MIQIIEDISTKKGLTKCIDDAVTAIMKFSFHDAEPFDEFDVDRIASYLKLELNHRSANLTDEEFALALENLNNGGGLLKCKFTSVWDNEAEIVTYAEYDPETGEVFAQESECSPGDPELVTEFITVVINGQSYIKEVCKECHEFVLESRTEESGKHVMYFKECPGCHNRFSDAE